MTTYFVVKSRDLETRFAIFVAHLDYAISKALDYTAKRVYEYKTRKRISDSEMRLEIPTITLPLVM